MKNMRQTFDIPADLYAKTIHFLDYDHENKRTETDEFLKMVPIELRKDLSVFVYKDKVDTLTWLKTKSKTFITWICPKLNLHKYVKNQYIYVEGDDVSAIYFLLKGEVSFVLPTHRNVKYIDIQTGDQFGLMDIAGEQIFKQTQSNQKDVTKRQFTVMSCDDGVEILQLSLEDLNEIRKLFPSNYLQLLSGSFDKLMGSWMLKLKATQKSRRYKKDFNKRKKKEVRERFMRKFQVEAGFV